MQLAVISETTITLMIGQAVLLLGGIGKFIWDLNNKRELRKDAEEKRKQDLQDREQDRLDREQMAKFTQQQLDELAAAGSAREKKIVGEVIKTRGVAIQAFKEANNTNAKVAEATQIAKDALVAATTTPVPSSIDVVVHHNAAATSPEAEKEG